MCELCNEKSNICNIFYDDINKKYYLHLMATVYDEYDDWPLYIDEEILYCPYCGRKLSDGSRE